MKRPSFPYIKQWKKQADELSLHMRLKNLEEIFTQKLSAIYPREEAVNIFQLVIENLTGINLRQNKPASFTPDGCFMQMLEEIQNRLLTQEPIQYILNEAWFYDIPFYVNRHVLIPRPETEELVDWILKENLHREGLRIMDWGTGSGCIPVILKRKLPAAEITACDISREALEVAQKNARKYKVEITWLEADVLDPLSWPNFPRVDILVSNPPYIPEKERTSMQENVVSYEPSLALFVNEEDPLLFYRAIATAGKQLLKPGGSIYVEIHENFGDPALALFIEQGYEAVIRHDAQGKQRMIQAVPSG